MTYNEFIENILHTRGRFACGNEYCERHHIVPKCKNGSNDENNLIDLFAKEHFIAHKLLYLENPDDAQLAYAYTLMAFMKDRKLQRYELTPEEYEEARKVYAIKFSGKNNPSAKSIVRLCDEKIYDTVEDCIADNNISRFTIYERLKVHRDFMYYDEWIETSSDDLQVIRSVNWNTIEHLNRSQAAKRAGNGGSISCSQETRRKIGLANKLHGVSVYCPELNESFLTIKEAADKYLINKTSIGYCLCGKQKHAGKHPVTGEMLTWVKLENKI